MLYDSLVLSPEYRDLSTQARSLLVEFARIYRPGRNGNLSISTREVIEWLGVSKDTASKLFYELAEHGFIRQTEHENWMERQARKWEVTWESRNNREPGHDWKGWQPGKDICPLPKKAKRKNKTPTPNKGARQSIQIGQAAPKKRAAGI